ncbi:hypothetical protein EV561_14126 [Rhizobium sp. BK376]|nr:hypothetical protein EV561_14126 [Rhizobium sp. BK376]
MTKPEKSKDALERRAEERGTIAAALPIERRDAIAELLTDQDVETQCRSSMSVKTGDRTDNCLLAATRRASQLMANARKSAALRPL